MDAGHECRPVVTPWGNRPSHKQTETRSPGQDDMLPIRGVHRYACLGAVRTLRPGARGGDVLWRFVARLPSRGVSSRPMSSRASFPGWRIKLTPKSGSEALLRTSLLRPRTNFSESVFNAKVVSHGRYVICQMAEVAIARQMFQEILRLIAELPPQPPPALA